MQDHPSEGILIGLMSGTSMDGIDALLVEFTVNQLRVLGHHEHPYSDSLRRHLSRAVANQSTPRELGELDQAVGNSFAAAALALMDATGMAAEKVLGIGSHGQTLRHCPEGTTPFTLQIGDPNQIAEQTGITTVADFRRRDMAAGGQGAPLASGFHAWRFAHPDEHRAVLNLGGIANLTFMPPGGEAVTGFDTGPGNGLLDSWCEQNRSQPFDPAGAWAASGRCCPELLSDLLTDAYFKQPPPKTTGRDHFNLAWLSPHLKRHRDLAPADVQRTLLALTVESVAQALDQRTPVSVLYVCGGGVRNDLLMRELRRRLPNVEVASTASEGIDPQHIEAAAFAWMAWRTLRGEHSNIPSVTGARGPRVLGAIYPGS